MYCTTCPDNPKLKCTTTITLDGAVTYRTFKCYTCRKIQYSKEVMVPHDREHKYAESVKQTARRARSIDTTPIQPQDHTVPKAYITPPGTAPRPESVHADKPVSKHSPLDSRFILAA
jgi:hypothetical protein